MSSSSIPTKTKQYLLTSKPTAQPILSGDSPTFTLKESPLPELSTDQVLMKTLYLSNDPAQRGWIQKDVNPERLYVPPIELNTPMRAYGLAQVLKSNSDAVKEGDTVVAWPGWTEYAVADAKDCQVVQEIEGIPVTAYLGALGITGLTAYYGLVDIVRATKEDVVVVSGAAGATGSMVVQIAKHIVGCKKVIGIAGSAEKCKFVEEHLGADVCLNYKDSSFEKELKTITEGFVDVYFDNVGGPILDLMLGRMKKYGRVAACGAISGYNGEEPLVLKNWLDVILMRIEIKGFIVLDAAERFGEMREKLVKAAKEGTIKVSKEQETVVEAKFEDVPKTWMKLFEGGNTGKLLTKVVDGHSSKM